MRYSYAPVCVYAIHMTPQEKARIQPAESQEAPKRPATLSINSDLLNKAAMAAYNDHVEKHGVFSDGLRSF